MAEFHQYPYYEVYPNEPAPIEPPARPATDPSIVAPMDVEPVPAEPQEAETTALPLSPGTAFHFSGGEWIDMRDDPAYRRGGQIVVGVGAMAVARRESEPEDQPP